MDFYWYGTFSTLVPFIKLLCLSESSSVISVPSVSSGPSVNVLTDRGAAFRFERCDHCSFVGESSFHMKLHMSSIHPDEPEQGTSHPPVIPTHSPVQSAENALNDMTDDAQEDETPRETTANDVARGIQNQTPYNNPNWLNEIKAGFKRLVISRCSAATQEAVEANDDIKVCI